MLFKYCVYCFFIFILVQIPITKQEPSSIPDKPLTGVRLFLDPQGSISNFTVLSAVFFDDTENILWCQSANNETIIGEWYYPNGNQVTTNDDSSPIRAYHSEGQVALLRNSGISENEGLYRCVIPDENGINQTLWVGIYTTSTYNDNTKNIQLDNSATMKFSLISADSIDADPSIFTLSFNITNYPPSTVTCTVNVGGDILIGFSNIDVNSDVISSPDPVSLTVTVTISTRQSGNYVCEVSAEGPAFEGLVQPAGGATQYTNEFEVTVTNTPTNLSIITNADIDQANLIWSPPAISDPTVLGYEVFYESFDSSRQSIDVGNNTSAMLYDLVSEQNYSVFVIAYGGNLPSAASNIVEIIIEGIAVMVGQVKPKSKPHFIALNNEISIESIRHSITKISFAVVPTNLSLSSLKINWYFIPSSLPDIQQIINANSKYIFSSDKLTLTINDSQSTDVGDYKIIGNNTAGSGEGTITLIGVYVAVNLKESNDFELITKLTGETVQFECTADGYPRPHIIWRHNGQPLLTNTSRHTITYSYGEEGFRPIPDIQQITAYLSISDLTGSDNGSYSCRADNEAKMPVSMTTPFTLGVKEPVPINYCDLNPCIEGACRSLTQKYSCICNEGYTGINCDTEVQVPLPPTITVHPTDTIGELYSTVSLTCKATGIPTLVIIWFKDNVTINNDNTDQTVLEFSELDLDDRGFYHCEAYNYINGEKVTAKSETVILNIENVIQYEAVIEVADDFFSNLDRRKRKATGFKPLDDLIKIINDRISGNDITNEVSFFLVEVKQPFNVSSEPPPKYIPIVLTLVTNDGGSDQLLEEVTQEMQELEKQLSVNITLQSVDRFDGCRSDITIIPSHSGDTNLTIYLSWSEANIGETVTVDCPCGNLTVSKDVRLTATRYCGGDFTNGGKWSNGIVDQCNFTDLSREICQLLDLQVDQRVNQLDQFTATPSTLQTTEVLLSVSVLTTATNDIKGNRTLSESFLNVADNILQVDVSTLKESQQTFNTSAKILEAIQSVADSIPIDNSYVPVVIARSQFAVSAQSVESDTLGQMFSVELANGSDFTSDSLNFMTISNSSTASISIPNNVFKSFSSSTLRLTNAVYLQESAFLRRNDDNLELGSIIISASVHSTNVLTSSTSYDPPIVLSFKRTKPININRDPVCSFWDQALDSGYGNWSSVGCNVNLTNENITVCLCNHLTSFSILLDVSPSIEIVQSPAAEALNAVTYIGIIVSLFCLVVLCASYLQSKKLRSSEHGQLLLNLCFALIGLYTTFILALHSAPVTWFCAFVSALLQYFFLATFLAMAAEAINLYLKLVVVLGSKISHYVLKVVIINWSVPFFIVLFCFAPKYENYVSDHFCRVFNAPYYVGVVVPFLLIYIFNCVVFAMVFFSLLRKSYKSKHTKFDSNAKDSNVSFVRQQLVIVFTLSVLFGIGWGIGLLATQDAYNSAAVRDTFSALFVLTTAFHGMFIFIMNGVRSKDVRSVWKKWFKLATRKKLSSRSTLERQVMPIKKPLATSSSKAVQSELMEPADIHTYSTCEKVEVSKHQLAYQDEPELKPCAETSFQTTDKVNEMKMDNHDDIEWQDEQVKVVAADRES